KTGTLTAGRPAVTAVRPADGVSEAGLLGTLAALESGSEHPLGKAIVAEANARGIAFERARDVRAVPGGGVTGTIGGVTTLAGSEAFLAACGIAVPEAMLGGADGGTVVLLAAGGALRGAVTLADPLKPHAREALAELSARGLSLHLLSGDRPAAVAAAAREAGIPEANAMS
ncbi:MAG TPA: HAD family hydrolase, partial [Thermoanaerobaculia bacterium]|nr:HAD family hydrolase [Thermoanaerobaculia bacterium]